MSKMPDPIQNVFDNLTGFQRTYCEFRAKNLSQAASAEKAGSQAQGRVALQSAGFQIEQIPGAKDYIDWLKMERAQVLPIDEIEIIGKLRAVYESAMDIGKLKEANEALELMGTIIGLFGHAKTGPKPKLEAETQSPFKDEGEDNSNLSERLNKILAMKKDIDSKG